MIDVLDGLGVALASRSSLERELGRGGMATVYLAHDLRHNRPIAVKVLHRELAATLGPERFQREIRGRPNAGGGSRPGPHTAARAGWTRGEIRTRLFRHSHCAARLQTLDAGAPVSIYMVAREVGHQSDEMVKRIYARIWARRGTGRTWWNTGPPSTSSSSAIAFADWGLLLGALLAAG